MMRCRLTLIGLACVLTTASARAAEPVPTFDADVKPILRKHCASCHNTERPRGELDLSNYASLLAGGVSGKAVVAKQSDASPMYTMAAHLEDPKMPPNKPKIPQRELDTIRKWIDGGLVEKSGNGTPLPVQVTAGGLVNATTLARASPVTALAVSPVESLVATAGKKQVLVYELPAGKLLGALPFPEGEVHALRFSRDGKVLIAAGGMGGQSGDVVGFEVGTWKRLFAIGGESDVVLAADISTDKTKVVLGGPSRVVKVFSVPESKQLHAFRKPTDWVLSVGFSPEGLLVAAGDRFGGLYVWETKSGKEFLTLRGHAKGVTGLAWRADSDALATGSEDGTVRLWNIHTGAETAKWEAHVEGVLDVAFHTTGVLATAGRDGRVKVWDQKGKAVAELGAERDAALRVGFTSDAKSVVSGNWSGETQTRPLTGGTATKLPLPLESKMIAAAIVPVATPAPVPVAAPTTPSRPTSTPATPSDLARKRAALKAVEEAAEKLKEEAARSPKNPALAKAYLQLCEAALALKTEVIETESTTGKQPEGEK